MATLQFQVDAVRSAVSSSSSCTPATIVSLKALLLPHDAESKSSQPAANSKISQFSRPTTANVTKAFSTSGRALAKRKPTASRGEGLLEAETCLSDKEKAQLATYVINVTLKSLAEATKPTPTPPAPKTPSRIQQLSVADDAGPPPKSGARSGLRRSTSAPLTPLQPRTLNRVSTSPMKPVSKAATTESIPAANQAAYLATVESARVAFSALRALQDAGKVVLPELQLEAGVSSFVAKLIGLNMLDQACRELRLLKRRLQGPPPSNADIAAPATRKATKTTAKPAAKSTVPAVASAPITPSSSLSGDLLDYGDLSSASGSTIKLVVTSQLQALRILGALKKPAYVELALPFLRRSCKSSPLHLLLRSAKAAANKQMDQEKVLRQMETLSQLLSALTPSISSKDDASANESKLSISPLVALELQTLSLETRLRSWLMVPNETVGQCDADKDVLAPFSRCLSAYARRSRSSGKAPSYPSCRRHFDHIQELIQSGELAVMRNSKSPISSIYQTLAVLSRDTGHLDDSIHWATELLRLLSPAEDSPARRCSISAQLLALQLKAATKLCLQESQGLLKEVLESIKGSLRGDTVELEELLSNVCLVRKAAVNLLIAQTTLNTNIHNTLNTNLSADDSEDRNSARKGTKIPESTRTLLESFVYQCPRFCLRWLGKPPAAKSSTKDFLRYEQRRQLLAQSIRHTLDSAFVVIKTMIEEGRMVWDQLDSVLGDSLTVLEYLGDLKATDAAASYYVKISHFYYLNYNTLRQSNADGASLEALKSLRRAIDSIKHRPAPEKERAQLIPKLERLAELSKSVGQIGEALGALQTIRTSLVDDGVLACVTAALDNLPPNIAWVASDQAESLSRTLVSIHRLEQVHIDWAASFEEAERAAVLEHQLHFIHLGYGSKSSQSGSNSSSPRGSLDLSHPCVESLLSIYYPTRYPIRRLRTLIRLYSTNIDRPEILAAITPQINAAFGLVEKQGLADDASLSSYLEHYQTLAASLTGFCEGYPDVEILQKCLGTWQSLVASRPAKSDLELAIDNTSELQAHLQSIAEFMRAMGRDTIVTAVLELSANLSRALLSATDNDNNSTSLAHDPALALSSHYVRTGECLKAEQVLYRVQSHLHQSSFASADALTSLHLAFAEYFIATGRTDEANYHLMQAKPFGDDTGILQKQSRRNGTRRRRLDAGACLLHSIVALDRGDFSLALQSARSGVRMLFHDWNRLEKSIQNVLGSGSETSEENNESTEEVSAPATASEESIDLGASLNETQNCDQSGLTSSDISTDSIGSTSKPAASPEFWNLFHPLFNGILRLSSVYAHLGMFQETLYYAEQAQKIATVTSAALSMAEAETWLGAVWLKAGELGRALVFVSRARSRLREMDHTSRKAYLACELSSLYREMKDSEGEQDMIAEAKAIVQHISPSENSSVSPLEDASESNEKSATASDLVKRTRAATGRKTKATTATTKATTKATGARKTSATVTKSAKGTAAANAASDSSAMASISLAANSSLGNATLQALLAAVAAQQALSLLSNKDWSAALAILRASIAAVDSGYATTDSRTRMDTLAGRVALAACLLGNSTDQMARDAVFSVIQDSTLSFPAVSGGIVSVVSGSAHDNGDRLSITKSPAATKAKGSQAVSGKAARASAGFVEMLQEAQDCLIEAQAIAAVSGDSSILNRISSMLQNAVIILSATSWSRPRALSHPAYASCSVELARNMTWRRERKAVLVEKMSLSKSESAVNESWWPVLSATTVTATTPTALPTDVLAQTPKRLSLAGLSSLSVDVSISRFQRDYIDIIPEDWSVISLALSENKHDLCITKLQAGHNPFVIRLPLERAISRDADNEVFNFQQGRAELLEIVKAINTSCHDARDMTIKGAKSAWWTERGNLDNRLKELLDNMEQIWLGGFRGIFSQHVRRPSLFSKFQKTFQNILDKHLPSRQAPSRGKKRAGKAPAASSGLSHRVSLDTRVLDLFIGLGDATVEGCDFDDALDDLLYFVVDILQFHGERNAYDEIDFDAMVVETFDALFAYHSAVRDSNARTSSSPAGGVDHLHTILVLDKALHAFPWEALPCMQELAVSRVPSLACLRRLIVEQRQISTDADELGDRSESKMPSGYRASATSGACVLNPSGDLRTTQTTFDGPLSSGLRGSWTRIVGRAPTEAEFEMALSDKDVLLYFGHGSGAQYIRGRTVRKLERCRATALLMGCSSAGLNYNGEFELYGPVWNYMLAGCPAVVGTLWDVTDKDIDRFAGRTFEEWGLVPKGSFEGNAARTAAPPKKSPASASTSASLVEAVVRARCAPRFRYLTAAAVCVYGIPVYLS